MDLYVAATPMAKTKSHPANGRIGPRLAAITLATAVALLLGAAWWFGLREPRVVMHYPDDVREAWGLVEAYQKYHPCGVEFVGFTWADENTTRRFVARHHIAWPNGFEAAKVIDALQAAAPSIFVVARDGRILWNDDRSRFRHDVGKLARELAAAIETALIAPGSAPSTGESADATER